MLAHTDLSLLDSLHHVFTEPDHLAMIAVAAVVGAAFGWVRRRAGDDTRR